MLKLLRLRLHKIKYHGDSVGRDIHVEVAVFGKLSKIDRRINSGETKEVNQEIGRIETDKKSLQSDVSIVVIEKDFLFNDTGHAKSDIKIDTSLTKPQSFAFEVAVKESRSLLRRLFWGERKAIFEITLEVQTGEVERYTPDREDGWLVTINENGEEISLPAYIKVSPRQIKNGREYFIPLEGVHRDKLLSVKLQDDNSSHLISDAQHEPVAHATYSISKKVFMLNGKRYKTVDYPEAPWKKGIYNIGIPDYPHGRNDLYAEATRQKVWFPIDFESARYLHVGARSLGCMTIAETVRWMEIYNAIIKARKGDLKNVGILNVID